MKDIHCTRQILKCRMRLSPEAASYYVQNWDPVVNIMINIVVFGLILFEGTSDRIQLHKTPAFKGSHR